MYTAKNFKTKKALHDALKAGDRITIFEPGFGVAPSEGTVYLEGPHYPKPHRWYASAVLKDGVIVSLK